MDGFAAASLGSWMSRWGVAHPPLHSGHSPLSWNFDPLFLIGLGLSLGLYAGGVYRLWTRAGRGRGVRVSQAAAFFAGWLALGAALITPIDSLSEVLFSAHMLQHMLLVLVAAPLLAISAFPLAAFWWLPVAWARPAGSGWNRVRKRWKAGRGWANQPFPTAVLFAAVLTIWHLPALYQAALRDEFLHALEHLSFLVSALLFWAALFQPAGRKPAHLGQSVLSLFLLMLQGSALGALITFAAQPWYTDYVGLSTPWQLSALEDQQLAGLIMWLPGGILFVLINAGLLYPWLEALDPSGRAYPPPPPEPVPPEIEVESLDL